MGATGRCFPDVKVRHLVVNQSYGITPKLIVVHATEGHNLPGVQDLENLADWFSNPQARASSHVATDADGLSARFVQDDRKAWHVAGYNSVALGVEQVGSANQETWDTDEIHETARWLAYWSLRHGIPLRKGRVLGGVVVRRGVVRHSELGAKGGNHDDPGKGYPLTEVLILARAYLVRQREYEKAHNRKVAR